jgi:hypothetical protein
MSSQHAEFSHLISFKDQSIHCLSPVSRAELVGPENSTIEKSCLLRASTLDPNSYGIYNVDKDSIRVRKILPFGTKEAARNT